MQVNRVLLLCVLAMLSTFQLAHAQQRQQPQATAGGYNDRDRSPFARPEMANQQQGGGSGHGGYPQQQQPYPSQVPSMNPAMQAPEPAPSMLPNQELRQLGTELQTTLELLAVQLDPPTSARVRMTRGYQQQSRTVLQGEVVNLGNVQYTVRIEGDSLANARLLLLVPDTRSKPKKGQPRAMLVAHEVWMGSAPTEIITVNSGGRGGNQGNGQQGNGQQGQRPAGQMNQPGQYR